MKILIYCPSKFNLNSKNNDKLGGIETLNLELSKIFHKIHLKYIYLQFVKR